ncbi:kelch domain-containing protein 4 [Cryptosporidium felis]|nr:kelch domain-containing protein 4 [Cryptosporidium felis]
MTKKNKDLKLKRAAEKREKQLFKSRNKHLKELKREGIEDIIKKVENLDLFSKCEAHEIQCSIIQSERPSPRVSSSFNIHPITGEVIIFGGEYYDGREVKCFHDLYKWNIERNDWKKVAILNKNSPNTFSGGPKPRCSHQGVIYNECLFIHGGEYSTENQFYHFRDLWKLNLKNYTWEEMKTTGLSPSPRSGHRMVVWRHFFVVFGGFHDTLKESRYFNDIHILNTKTWYWTRIDSTKFESCPTPRSGVQMVLCSNSDKIFIHGGYSKIKDNSKNSVGKVHSDSWILDMKPFLNDGKPPIWERISKKGNPPTQRSGSTIIGYKNQCIVFGGVYDQEDELGLNLNSTFYNDLYTFEVNSRRWYKLELSCKDKLENPIEDQVLVNENNLMKSNTHISNLEYGIENNKITEQKSVKISDNSKSNTLKFNCYFNDQLEPTTNCGGYSTIEPIPRINSGMFVIGNHIYIFGGIFESGKKNITLDDCWSFNILKKDKWTCVIPPSLQEWSESDSDTDSHISSDDYSSSYENYLSDEESESSDHEYGTLNNRIYLPRRNIEQIIKRHELDDLSTTPLISESLRDFFLRTKSYWLELTKNNRSGEQLTQKEISRNAFLLAEERFNKTIPYVKLLDRVEKNQNEVDI